MTQQEQSKWYVGSHLSILLVTLMFMVLTASVGATVTATMWRADLQSHLSQIESRVSSLENWRIFVTEREFPASLASIQESIRNIENNLTRLRKEMRE